MTKNNLGMREITVAEAEKLGIDLSMAKICRTLRKLAKLDRLKLDETEHRSGLNKHLFHRSEERRVGKECPSQCRSRWSPYH